MARVLTVIVALWALAFARIQGQEPVPTVELQTATVSPDLEGARSQIGFRGTLGLPVGDFDDSVGLSGGLSGDFTYRVGDGPFRVGGGMNVLWYGRERRKVPLSVTIPDVLVDVTTSSGILTSYGLFRVQSIQGRVRPYADGLIGFNYIFTQTAVDLDDDAFLDGQRVTTTNFRDFAFSFGGGGGVMIDLMQWTDGRFSLDIAARYIFGGEADYLVERPGVSVARVGDLALKRSRTDVVVLHFGATVEL